jgi:integrase
MTRRLTKVAIDALLRTPPKKRMDLMDAAVPGLMLRIGAGGATWSLRIRVVGEGGVTGRGHKKKGNKKRLTLGEYPVTSIEAARAKANQYLDQAKKGERPTEELEKAATAGGLTVKALAEKFLADYVDMKKLRALRKYESALNVHVVPAIGNVLADVLSREQIRGLVKKAMIRVPRETGPKDRPKGGKEAARTVVGVVRKMINWGMREELLKRTDNPVAGMEDNLPKKRRKERVLSLEEARIAWHAAGTLGYPFGPAYQLIMLSGCRPGEWSTGLWPYVDLNQSLLVIPADVYKTDHVHVIPLVPIATQILQGIFTDHRGHKGEYILSGTYGKSRLSGWTKGHARMMRAICAVSGERPSVPWTPHDLRRTVATRIAEQLGVGGEQLIKRVLGHSDGSVTAIYNRYGYVKEMRAVLERWAAELTCDPITARSVRTLDASVDVLRISEAA